MIGKKLISGMAALAIAGLFSSAASAAVIVEVTAIAGTGYTVSNGGKTVTLNNGVTSGSINLQLVTEVGTNASNDALLQTSGDIISTAASGNGALTAGGITTALRSAFKNNAFSAGLTTGDIASSGSSPVETYSADGVLDDGHAGNSSLISSSPETHTMAGVGGATSDWINASQNATSPAGTGNQVIGDVTLAFTATGTGTTQVQWYYRSGTSNTAWEEGGTAIAAGSKVFGTTINGNSPVLIQTSVPEPASLAGIGLAVFGLLGSRRRKA